MKVFIIAAITADGLIGRNDGHSADWTGSADKKVFVRLTKDAGVMVMGARTFHTINRALPDRLTIVYTHHPANMAIPGVETTDKLPKDLLSELEERGFTQLAVCGGSTIYRQFLEAGVVNELYLTVVPKLFGQGVSLFEESVDTDLELLSSEELDGGAVLLHYHVLA